jgi:hypothetical protein
MPHNLKLITGTTSQIDLRHRRCIKPKRDSDLLRREEGTQEQPQQTEGI